MGEKRKITCKSFLDEMSDYLDGDLPPEFRASLEAHLAKCPQCWVLLDETRQTVEIVQTYDCHPLPADVKVRLVDAIQKHWDKT
jgi:anti-sigma factor (TIGR02949 family)